MRKLFLKNSQKVTRGVGLDVHENEGEGKVSPFASFPNVVLTPHVGAQTLDSQREIGDRVLESVQQFEAKLNQQESISSTVSK
jgi:phosphoglycerate dehydrogenase-like enzyme